MAYDISETSKQLILILADSSTLDVIQNGTTYTSTKTISEVKALLTEDNLQTVIIDGTSYYDMVIDNIYETEDGGTYFTLREQTTIESLQSQILETQEALAEVYEMLITATSETESETTKTE